MHITSILLAPNIPSICSDGMGPKLGRSINCTSAGTLRHSALGHYSHTLHILADGKMTGV
jgi:hypothetical protein